MSGKNSEKAECYLKIFQMLLIIPTRTKGGKVWVIGWEQELLQQNLENIEVLKMLKKVGITEPTSIPTKAIVTTNSIRVNPLEFFISETPIN